jgi:hypothetical protein
MKKKRHINRRMKDCRWSGPACRRSLISDRDTDFKIVWLCERTDPPTEITEKDCRHCTYWLPEHA